MQRNRTDRGGGGRILPFPQSVNAGIEAYVAREIECELAMQPFTRVARAVAASFQAAGLEPSTLMAQAVQQNLGGLSDLLDASIRSVREIGGHLPNPATGAPHLLLALSERNGALHGGHVCK